MTKTFKLSPEAQQDLYDIWSYIADDNISAANRVEKDIYDAMNKLSSAPFIGHIREDITEKSLRFWSVHSYMIVYNPETHPLWIVRVLSGYRDITDLLGD